MLFFFNGFLRSKKKKQRKKSMNTHSFKTHQITQGRVLYLRETFSMSELKTQ